MAFKQDELEFWLPSDVLAVEDTSMETNFRRSDSVSSRFLLPTEEVKPLTSGSSLSSPGKSVVGSTETGCDEDVYLLSELTRQLALLDGDKFAPTQPTHEMNYLQSGSPQSTLLHVNSWSGRSTGSSNGSPNGPSQVSSPPTTPLSINNSSWDLIYRAAGLVEGLKSNTAGGLTPSISSSIFHRQGSLSTLPPPKSAIHSSVHPNYPLQGEGYGIRSGQERNMPKIGGLAVNAGGWPPHVYNGYPNPQVGHKHNLPQGPNERGCGFNLGYGYGYGSGNQVRVGGVKSERVGTGVFLPRRYDGKNSGNSHGNGVETRKKSGNSSAYSNKMDPVMSSNFNNKGRDTITDYDALLARRLSASVSVSVPVIQRKTTPFKEAPIHHEICLPQEWTY